MLNTAQKGKEADRGQKSGNITVDFLAEPVSDMKGCVLSVIIRDNCFFVLASKRSDWQGDACDYYTIEMLETQKRSSLYNIMI